MSPEHDHEDIIKIGPPTFADLPSLDAAQGIFLRQKGITMDEFLSVFPFPSEKTIDLRTQDHTGPIVWKSNMRLISRVMDERVRTITMIQTTGSNEYLLVDFGVFDNDGIAVEIAIGEEKSGMEMSMRCDYREGSLVTRYRSTKTKDGVVKETEVFNKTPSYEANIKDADGKIVWQTSVPPQI